MKKTLIMKFVFALGIALFLGSAAMAQSSTEVQSVKANLVEVNATIADLQSKDPSNPDLPELIEKRDYLQQIYEELTSLQGGSEGEETSRTVSGKKGTKTVTRDQATLNPATATSGKSDEDVAKLQKELARLRALKSQDANVQAKIRAYENRIKSIKKMKAN